MGLSEYDKKRRFTKTPEPGPKEKRSKSGRLFVIQKHRASHLHYDFRLESDGVLKSWAVPKGPSLDPAVKRLAMQVEDHPVDYADFEGIIPEGEYGGGTVMVWDQGTYESEKSENISSDIHRGEVKINLHGEKLNGSWALVRTNDRQWLLIKHRDKYATTEEVAEKEPFSVISGRTLAEIAEDEGGNIKKAATGDPAVIPPHTRRKKSSKAKASVWHSNRTPEDKSSKKKAPRAAKKKVAMPAGARKAKTPSKLSPMLATPTDAPFNDKKWVFEIMWDGVRATCFLKDGSIELVNRTGDEITDHYDELAQIAGEISAETAVLDGEIVALDEKGVPGSQLDEPRAGRKGKRASTRGLTTVYYAFDIVHYNGYDLMKCKLEDRRALLQKILSVGDTLRFSDSVKGEGEQFFRLVEEKGLKGIVAKRVDSKYVQRRSRDWLNLKTDGTRQDPEPEASKPVRVVQSKKPKNSSKKEPLPASALSKRPLTGNMQVRIHGETLSLTNLDKVYFPDDGYTKGDLLRYYYEIASTMIPYYKDRPLIMKRYPNGISGHVFHQHNLEKPPAFVETYTREREPRKESVVYGLINNVETLLYIANLGAVSLHPWSSRPDTLEQADWIIFDVDPGDATFHTVCDVALEVKKVLDEIGLEGFPKTSGSKGIHVFVPVKPQYTYDQVVPFANAVAALIARRRPDIVGIERMRVKRKEGRVYLDFLQNGFGKTVAGVYSLRARPGAPLSAPLEWAEVKAKKITPLSFTMQTIFKRLEKKGDLFRPVLSKRQTLDTAVAKLSERFDQG